jgi:hypothetical protein
MMLLLLLRQSLSRKMSQRKKKRKLSQRLLKSQSKSQSRKLQRLRKLNQLLKRNLMKARLLQLPPKIPQSLKAKRPEVDAVEAVDQDQTGALEVIEEQSAEKGELTEEIEEPTEVTEELTEAIGVIEEPVAEEEAKTGEVEMVRTMKASSLSRKMAIKIPEVEAEAATEVEETEVTEVTEAPGEATMKLAKVTSEVAQDHQEAIDLQEPELTTQVVIFQESPLPLLIQSQQLLKNSECPELLASSRHLLRTD